MINKIKKIGRGTINHVYRFVDYCIYKSSILQHPKYNKNYDIAICAIFKDEARFLKEWIEYHLLIGVEHFYLYNNNSTDNYREVLEEYIKSGFVTLKEWPYQQGQITAYRDFYDNHWQESQWVTFLDIDEFYVPKEDNNLLDWIKKNDHYPVLLVYWKMFGSSSILCHDDNKLCIEQYVNSWDSLVKCGKCLINTDYKIAKFDATTHHATQLRSINDHIPIVFHPLDQFHHINFHDKEKRISKSLSDNASIQINHYWSKGWDIYNKKRSWEGDVFFQNNPKKNIYYFIKNELRNTSIDINIQRYLLMLKWKLSNAPEYNEMLENKNTNKYSN